MDETSSSKPEGVDGLEFDKAEYSEAGADGLVCRICQTDIQDTYFDVNGQTTCESCRRELERQRTEGSEVGRMGRALGAGVAAGIVGSALYYAVLALTGYEIGLVAIVVGLIVGAAVRWGSGGVGGRKYQVLAVAITYVAIVTTYIPFIIQGFSEMEREELAAEGSAEEGDQAAAASGDPEEELGVGGFVLALAAFGLVVLASPLLAGFQNIIGMAIIGFALYEAWKINRHEELVIEGPLRVTPQNASSSPSASPGFPSLG